jgi:putative ABC transport system ATP-binding protein
METAAIHLSRIAFRWQPRQGDVLAIEEMTVRRGERLFVEGPSGSGKSTLLSLLAGVATPRRGEVCVLGRRLERLSHRERDHFRADHVGFIFQMFNLVPYLSVVENVLLPSRFSRLRRDRALARGGDLHGEARRLLAHLDLHEGLLERPVTQLSVGQQQRVAAARALLGRPEIVIADEPTSALDTDRREAFIRLLFEECAGEGETLVFVSHDRSLAGLFDRTLHLAEVNRPAAAV